MQELIEALQKEQREGAKIITLNIVFKKNDDYYIITQNDFGEIVIDMIR